MAAVATDAADQGLTGVATLIPRLGVLGSGEDWLNLDRETILLLSYLLLAIITFGVHSRARGRNSRLGLMKSAFWGLIWPIYWLGPIGPLGTLRRLLDLVIDTILLFSRGVAALRNELLFIYYSVALLFMPAYQIYLRWDGCVGAGSCSWTVLKSFLWGIVWPLYIVVKLFNL